MLADFFTKPLQGDRFQRFRDVVMGYKHINTLQESDVTTQERVRSQETPKHLIGSLRPVQRLEGAVDKPNSR